MIEIKILEVAGIGSALKALRLPYGKDVRSISFHSLKILDNKLYYGTTIQFDDKDLELVKKLINAGDEHAKIMRGVVCWLEINAPRYWWQEMETYRIGHERLSSESTMHIQGKGLSEDELVRMKDELKEGTMQKRIDMFSYQTLRRIYKQRKNHRLPHWREFCKFLTTLPMSEWIIE